VIDEDPGRMPAACSVSCDDSNWKERVARLAETDEVFWIRHAHSVEDIEFISAFAAEQRLQTTYRDGAFCLRRPNVQRSTGPSE
jgi:hypothetical protein